MPRKYRPPTGSNANSVTVNRQTSPAPIETGDAEKDAHIWMSRILKTLHTRIESDNGDRHWDAYINWFNGLQWQHEDTGKNGWDLYSDTITSIYTNNLVQSIASAYMPFLLNGEIEFKAKPKPNRPGDAVAAEIHTSLLNYEWGERNATEQVKLVIDDVVTIGHGIAKTGYVVEVDKARRKDQGSIEYRKYVRKDACTVEWVSPFDFLHDLTGRDGTLRTAHWAAERSWVPFWDLIANTRYSQKALEMIRSGVASHNLSMRSGFRDEAKSRVGGFFGREMGPRVPEESLIGVWEIWDWKYQQVITMAEGLPYPLDIEEWRYPYLDGFPFVMIPFLRAKKLLYPIGIARQLKDAQLQTNRIRTQQVQNVRSQKDMYGYDVNKVNKESIEDFADLPTRSVIGMQGPDGIFPIPNPQSNRDVLILEQSIAQDAQRTTGADAIFQGQPLGDRTTAGEVSARINIVRLKADDKVSNVENGVTEIARQMLQHLKANRVQDDVISVVGLLGTQWRQYSNEDIQAETDVTVEYFAAPKTNPDIERQQKSNVFSLAVQAAPVMAQQGAQNAIDFTELFAWLLKSFPDIQDAGRFFKPALVVHPELKQIPEGAGAGAGLPPALAGQLAPGQLPPQPGIATPGEGGSVQDLLQQILGAANRPA